MLLVGGCVGSCVGFWGLGDDLLFECCEQCVEGDCFGE